MNQIKIGKFIASCRKNKGYTQLQLAEKLGVTDRAVSKWETGKNMPDAAIMLELCQLLDINVNELLTGEKISQDDYQRNAEKNMVEIIMKNKVSMEERVITALLIISIFAIAVAGCVVGKMFAAPAAQAAIMIMSLVSEMCIVAVWIAVTICLRKK